MRIFDKERDSFWGHKVNFVDDKGVFVGYDMAQCCCENASWYISESPEFNHSLPLAEEQNREGWEAYSFDPEFLEEGNPESLECGGYATFRMTCPGKPDAYLHLYNAHNGYYSHGFYFGVNGKNLEEGSL